MKEERRGRRRFQRKLRQNGMRISASQTSAALPWRVASMARDASTAGASFAPLSRASARCHHRFLFMPLACCDSAALKASPRDRQSRRQIGSGIIALAPHRAYLQQTFRVARSRASSREKHRLRGSDISTYGSTGALSCCLLGA